MAAARQAATPVSGPSPRTTGTPSANSQASDFAGLTNASELGRNTPACSSSRSATPAMTAGPASTIPNACAPRRTGVSIAHSAVREDIDPTGTERWIPRARAATSASGESAAPMVSRAAPRRAASAASATGPSAWPDCDTATTRSMEPTQPGSGRLRRIWTGTGECGSASTSRTSAMTADPPSAATSTDRGRSPPVSRSNRASAARSTACRTCAPAVARARRVWRESRAASACWSSRTLSSM